MVRVEVSAAAAEGLQTLIVTHSLHPGTRERVRLSLRLLERFPLMGAELSGRWSGFRFLLGPWRWLLMVYVCFEQEDRLVVVTFQDGRSSGAATAGR